MKLIRSTIDLSRVLIMGVLNVTPDSFSDGGRFSDPDRAFERAMEMEAEGAGVIDIGGESTRPGSEPVSIDEELDRVLPVIRRMRENLHIPISIDTTKGPVAAQAIDSGAEIINDISGLRFDPSIAGIAAKTGASLILMHSRGTPANMQKLPPVEDVLSEIIAGLRWSVDQAVQRGVKHEKIVLDPGIGFGKTPRQNLQLINNLNRIVEEFGLPVLLGTSRKSFIQKTLDSRMQAQSRDARRESSTGTIASNVIGVLRGANMLRVHDVGETVAAVRLAEAIIQSDSP
ncbi:MAG: dihydropteroate synthase [Acidobacteria bacterium]|nr:dihydropteroate synthase [Acidobacteriota bacterium]